PVNIGRELADVTKYVISLWELFGFSPTEMLSFVDDKTEELERLWRQEFTPIPSGSKVAIVDLDGTLADYRAGFVSWLKEEKGLRVPYDPSATLSMEVDLGIDYLGYVKLKEEFEASGGYRTLPMYEEVPSLLYHLSTLDKVSIVVFTARPQQILSHIRQDTWSWLRSHNLAGYISELHVVPSEARIVKARELQDRGHPVVLLDDDPTTCLRAASSGIPVFMRSHNYNLSTEHRNITRVVESFSHEEINRTLRGQIDD
ncbi:MAG: hypothetical protein MI802_28450, partial [Desulfobacterales bacterium]|nr:hypothetical protein [Desulfobacterales bacterium]